MPRYSANTIIPSARFSTSPPTYPHTEGLVYWDDVDGTLALMLQDGTTPVTLQVGQENFIRIRNNTGAQINNGQVVYLTGSLAYRPTAALAQADALATTRNCGVATQNIPNNDEGIITTLGLVRDFDTQTPGWNEGDQLYLDPAVAGGLTNTIPASGFNLRVASVLRKHPTQGILFVCPSHPPAFGDITGGNYTQFEYDGTMAAIGNASAFRDELQPLIGSRLESPASDIQQIEAEGSIEFQTSARYPTDYVTTSIQINHDWKLGSDWEAHLHWW